MVSGDFMESQLKNHVIVCGYGVVGHSVVEVLKENHVEFVILEQNPKTVAAVKEMGYRVVEGDATSAKFLKQVGVVEAKAIAIVMDNDAKNLFSVLTARDLNANIFIVTRANDTFGKEKLTEAGANYVVLPHRSASREILNELLK
jgi:voltage-gated potassium channel